MTDFNAKNLHIDFGNSIQNFTLSNGLRIFVNPRHDAPVVSIQAWVETGSVHEGEYLGCGLSHFLEHMLFQGCENYPEQRVSDVVNELGGDINAYTSFDHTVYHVELPAAASSKGLDILSKMVSSATFPEEKFQSEKQVILRERDLGLDRPERMLSEELWKTVFLKHPVRHPIIGYHKQIESVSRELMLAYYKQRYSPERTFFVISGAVEPSAIHQELEQLLGAWDRGNIHEPVLTVEPWQLATRERECEFDDPLARLAIACRIPPATHEDIPALDLLVGLLGSSKSARLVKSLRNEKELALGICSYNFTPTFDGVAMLLATAQPEKLNDLEKATLAELKSIIENGVSEAELHSEKQQQITEYIRSLRTNSGVAAIIGQSVLTYGCPNMANRYLQLLREVDTATIKRVAAKYFRASNLSIVRQIPAAKNTNTHIDKNHNGLLPELHAADNGLRTVVLVDNKLPLVDISLAMPGGLIYEDPKHFGISRILAAMLQTGTSNLTEAQFNTALDAEGIDFEILGGANSLLFKINCLQTSLDTTLNLLEQVLLEPAFQQKQFEREQLNLIEALKSRAQKPSAVVQDVTHKELYGEHPFGTPQVGSITTIQSLTLDDLKEFWQRLFNPKRIVIGVAGAVDKDSVAQIETRLIKALTRTSQNFVKLPPPPSFPTQAIEREIVLPREQAMVMYTVPGCDNLSDDRLVMDVLHEALNGLSSKLFKAIREDNGLAYSTGTICSRGFHRGIVGFYAATQAETTAEVKILLQEQCARLAEEGLDEDEFEAARSGCRFVCSTQLERSDSLLHSAVLSEYYGNGFKAPFELPDKLRALDLKQVNQVLRKYFKDAVGVTVTAGPKA